MKYGTLSLAAFLCTRDLGGANSESTGPWRSSPGSHRMTGRQNRADLAGVRRRRHCRNHRNADQRRRRSHLHGVQRWRCVQKRQDHTVDVHSRRYGGYEEGWRVRIQTRAEGGICLTVCRVAGSFLGPLYERPCAPSFALSLRKPVRAMDQRQVRKESLTRTARFSMNH